jgi:hypothetical protein
MCAISSWRSGLVSADVSWVFSLLRTLTVRLVAARQSRVVRRVILDAAFSLVAVALQRNQIREFFSRSDDAVIPGLR